MTLAVRWVFALFIVLAFGMSLFYEFGDAPDSIYMFQTAENWLIAHVGESMAFVEPTGRYVAAAIKVVSCILVLIPGTRQLGAFIAVLVAGTALAFHLIPDALGIYVQGDLTPFLMGSGVVIAALGLLLTAARDA